MNLDHGIDTNVLLRAVDPASPDHQLALQSLRDLREQGVVFCITLQNLVEFWAVSTRPSESRGGLGFTFREAMAEIEDMESVYMLVPDTPAVLSEWKSILSATKAAGVRAHDARLAATFVANGISHILTFDVADFAGFSGITAVHPQDVVSNSQALS